MIFFISYYEFLNDAKSKIFSKNFKIENSRHFQKFITLRIIYRISKNCIFEHSGSTLFPSCCQKFRQHSLSQISATISKIRFCFLYFLPKSAFSIFSVWQGRGCAWSEISFWRDSHRLEVKPSSRLKCRTRSPRGAKNLFSSLNMDFGWYHHKTWKIHFWPSFETLYLREYFTEFRETASPNISGIRSFHVVAKNISNTFYQKY